MRDDTKLWLRKVGPLVGLLLLLGIGNGVYVLALHRDGGKDDVAPLAFPRHYVVQKPRAGAFEDGCVTKGWSVVSATSPTFLAGPDRERTLGVVPVGAKNLRVSLRQPAPRPTVLQIEFVGEAPTGPDDPRVREAKRVLVAIDDACAVPYVAPAECGALSTPTCRAFGTR